MSGLVITSRDNDRVRHARRVREAKVADEMFIEGVRLCEQAAHSELQITDLLHTSEAAGDQRAGRVLAELRQHFAAPAIVSERVFITLTDTHRPQGIAILAKRLPTDENSFERSLNDVPLLVILHKLNNPANAGAILRAAEAAGATGVVATNGTTDLFSPKALRGAMGSSFRLPIWTGADFSTVIEWCRERDVRTVCADVRATRTHTEFDWTVPCAFVVGPEANGLSNDEIALAGDAFRIPMRQPVESLNVAVASAVALYEAARQRQQ